jgi:hypothetical protein
MARTAKLAPTERSTAKAKQVVSPSRFGGIRNNLPTIFGAAALVAAGALAGTTLAHGGFDGRDGRHTAPGMEARMEMKGGHRGAGMGPGGMRKPRVDLTGTITSVSPTELSITLADGTTKTVVLDSASQYLTKSAGATTDVTVGSYVQVEVNKSVGSTAPEVSGLAVLTNGLTDAHVHLGHPAKVTAVNGSTLTLETATPRGTKTITVVIGAGTSISKIATTTNADLTAGGNVVVDLGQNMVTAKSVLIVK